MADDWQPIETAPRDGRGILGFKGDFGGVMEVCYPYMGEMWVAANGFVLIPTHWMPLPAPPEGV